MAIDIGKEQLISMSDAARSLPRRNTGKSVHVATVYRWANDGLQGVRLETIQVGGHCFSSREALGRFFAALTRLRETGRPVSSAERIPQSACAKATSASVMSELDARLGGAREPEKAAS